jgi:hypothetical protein
MTSRTVSWCAATSRAIAGTGVPDADAMMINARRTRIESCLPRRTICCNRRPSSSVSRRARTGSAIHPPTLDSDVIAIDSAAEPASASATLAACPRTGKRSWSAH